MNKSKELLPLGSIVYLKEGTQKLVIVGRGYSLTILILVNRCLRIIWGVLSSGHTD